MAFSRGPRIVTDGLVLALDAGNVKSNNSNKVRYVSSLSSSQLNWSNSYGTEPVGGESDPCSGAITFEQALDYAHSRGARLPTIEEVQDNAMRGTGCGYDNQLIWTCDKSNSDATAHYVLPGRDPFDRFGGLQSLPNTSTAFVRMVADNDLNRTDPVILDDSVILNYLNSNYSTSPNTKNLIGDNDGFLLNGVNKDEHFEFDGVDDYIIGESNLGISGDAEFTISYFGIWDGSSFSTNYPSAFGNNSVSSTNRGLSTTWKDGRVALDFWSNRFRSDTTLNVQTWYHLTFTKVPGLIGSNSKIYINGQQVNGSVEGSNTFPDIIDSNYIVGRLDNSRLFNGRVSDIKVYNRCLTDDEVLQNYNATKTRFGL